MGFEQVGGKVQVFGFGGADKAVGADTEVAVCDPSDEFRGEVEFCGGVGDEDEVVAGGVALGKGFAGEVAPDGGGGLVYCHGSFLPAALTDQLPLFYAPVKAERFYTVRVIHKVRGSCLMKPSKFRVREEINLRASRRKPDPPASFSHLTFEYTSMNKPLYSFLN